MKSITLLVFALVLTGCSGAKDSAPESKSAQTKVPTQAFDTRTVSDSWDEFISKAKTRKTLADQNFQTHYPQGDLNQIEFLRDDVKVDVPAKIATGEVSCSMHELSSNAMKNGSEGTRASWSDCVYTLRFRYKDGSWVFKDGTCSKKKGTQARVDTEAQTKGIDTLYGNKDYSHLVTLFYGDASYSVPRKPD